MLSIRRTFGDANIFILENILTAGLYRYEFIVIENEKI